jgi:hypothetical protein
MASRKRKGMIIKNSGTESVTIDMASRSLTIGPGEEKPITPEEVRDPILRESLQVRAISIVRPATEEEDAELKEKLEKSRRSRSGRSISSS